MATELKILSWCDVCLAAGKDTPGDTMTVAVGVVAPFDVEVCPKHAEPMDAVLAALAPLGRPVGKGVPKTPTPAPKTAPRARDALPGGTCPECSRVYETRNALRGHLRADHGKTLADVGLVPANETCPECGAGFERKQSLGVHLRTHRAAKKTA